MIIPKSACLPARTLACLAACTLLWSCTALPAATPTPTVVADSSGQPAAQSLAAQYANLSATDGRVLQLRPEASAVRIHVFRAGRAANLGHNHVLSAPRFEGFIYLPEKGLAQARFDLQFRLDELVFDLPEHRAALGPAYAAVLPDAWIEATREHMLGPDNMQAARYPEVRIQSLAISGEAPKLVARLAITLHGQTQALWVPLTVTGLPEQLQVNGSLVLRQTDFGVQPYSALGGLLAVQDEVLVEFHLMGQ